MEDRALLSTFLFRNPVDTHRGSLRLGVRDSEVAAIVTHASDLGGAGSGVSTSLPRSPRPTATDPVLIAMTDPPSESSRIAVEDVNGESITDLALPGGVQMELGQGTPRNGVVSLGNPASPPFGASKTTIIGDFNGDGIDDVLEFAAGSVLYHEGIPGQPGIFQPAVPLSPVSHSGALPSRRLTNRPILIAQLDKPDPAVGTIRHEGVDATRVYHIGPDDGFEAAVGGDSDGWAPALFEVGPGGRRSISVDADPSPQHSSELPFSALMGGALPFHAAAGWEAVELEALKPSTRDETASSRMGSSPSSPALEELVALRESSLPMVATALTLTIPVSDEPSGPELAESEAAAVAGSVVGPESSAWRAAATAARGREWATSRTGESDKPGSGTWPQPAALQPWLRFVLGLDEASEVLDRENTGGITGPVEPMEQPPGPGVRAQGGGPGLQSPPQRPWDAEWGGVVRYEANGYGPGSATVEGSRCLPSTWANGPGPMPSTVAKAVDLALARPGIDRAGSDPGEIDMTTRRPEIDEPGPARVCLGVFPLVAWCRALRAGRRRPGDAD